MDGQTELLYQCRASALNKKLSCRRELSYLTLSNIVTLKSGLRVTQGHFKWYHSKAFVRFPIRLP